MKISVFTACMAWFIVVSVTACDLDTEYEKDGVCCKMCGPGTRMMSGTSCRDPVCTPCGKDEYQAGFTRDNKCQLQPYCDKNVNLEQKELVPTARVPCTCKAEHHCSSKDCLTCVPNRVCSPGEGVLKMATQFNDTICQLCGQGTFSSERSSVKPCRTWTTCDEKTHRIKTKGTSTSDVECEEATSGTGVAVGVSIFVGVLVILAALLIYFLKKDPKKLKNCFRKHTEPVNEFGQGQQRHYPQEDEETPHTGLTDNNNPVMLEEGKKELLSVPESEQLSDAH